MPLHSGGFPYGKNHDPGLFSSKGFGGVKLIIGLAFVFSLAALTATVFLSKALSQERKQRQALEAAHEQIREKSASLDQSARQYQNEIKRMREQLRTYALERKQLQAEVQQVKPKAETPAPQSTEIPEGQTQAAPKEPSPLVEAVLALSGKTPAAAAKTPGGEPAAVAAPAVKPDLSAPSQPAEAEPAAPAPVTAAPASEEKIAGDEAPKTKSASILTVNRKFNFAVVNIGLQDGVQIGDVLFVERAGKETGNLRVEKTYENFAAAAIVKEDSKTPIQQGDLIRKA